MVDEDIQNLIDPFGMRAMLANTLGASQGMPQQGMMEQGIMEMPIAAPQTRRNTNNPIDELAMAAVQQSVPSGMMGEHRSIEATQQFNDAQAYLDQPLSEQGYFPARRAINKRDAAVRELQDQSLAEQDQRFRDTLEMIRYSYPDMGEEAAVGVARRAAMGEDVTKLLPALMSQKERLLDSRWTETKDQRYQNGLRLASELYSHLDPQAQDAMARELAEGSLNFSDIIPEAMSEYERELLALERKQRLSDLDDALEKGAIDNQKWLVEQGEVLYENAAPFMESLLKSKVELGRVDEFYKMGYESGAAQIGALYSIIRGLDPDSVVREAEAIMASKSGSTLMWLESIIKGTVGSAVIPEPVFNDLLRASENVLNRTIYETGKGLMQVEDTGQQRGIPRELYLGNESMTELEAIRESENYVEFQKRQAMARRIRNETEQIKTGDVRTEDIQAAAQSLEGTADQYLANLRRRQGQ